MAHIDGIMTQNPVFVSQHININKARKLMAENKIRHLPVKDSDTGHIIGMLSQKELLANALRIINQRGLEKLEYCEKSMDVASLMSISPVIFERTAEIQQVALSLNKLKSGCIAIVEDDRLVGVVTSSDFVKFAANYAT